MEKCDAVEKNFVVKLISHIFPTTIFTNLCFMNMNCKATKEYFYPDRVPYC